MINYPVLTGTSMIALDLQVKDLLLANISLMRLSKFKAFGSMELVVLVLRFPQNRSVARRAENGFFVGWWGKLRSQR